MNLPESPSLKSSLAGASGKVLMSLPVLCKTLADKVNLFALLWQSHEKVKKIKFLYMTLNELLFMSSSLYYLLHA